MGLDAAYAVGVAGLANVSNRFAVVSQNVANASTPGYSEEIATQSDLTVDGIGAGVRAGATGRDVDQSLQSDLFAQQSGVAALQTRQAALQQIDAVQGQVGQGGDLASLLGKLQDAFTALAGDPSSQTQQTAVVDSAQALAGQINTLSRTYTTGRQNAQDALSGAITTLNATLGTIGGLSDQIVALKAQGRGTADLENQRDAALSSLSQLVEVRFTEQPNGDVQIVTAAGLNLPVHGGGTAFSVANASLSPGAAYPAGAPAITWNGVDVTGGLTGGQIGANLSLRDQTLPGYQASLDEFAQTLSTRFAAQGLTLFTDASGQVPVAAGGGTPAQTGYVGYAATVQVNPAVTANAALVRDGTNAVADSASGASAFTPNPSGGPAGFSTLITRVLTYALGTEARAGVAQPAPGTTGLGPRGTLSAGFGPPADLAGFAASVVTAESRDSDAATGDLSTSQDTQAALQTRITAATGVSIDTEMGNLVVLQNAYSANARVLSTIQAMWTQLLQSL